MGFPYPSVRLSQADMMRDVRDALGKGMHLVADAPTGLGKTVASLLPAIEYATENSRNVFFLTSRLSQHRMAIETMQMIKEAGLEFSAVDIVGKRHTCSQDTEGMQASMFNNFCSSMIKDKRCAYYKNFHRKDLEADRAAIVNGLCSRIMSTQEAYELASGRYCTYELLMEAAKSSCVIAGDYFHIFGMGEKFLKRAEKTLESSIIIVDEAHNLPSRLRSYMSSSISTRICELAAREAAEFDEGDVEDYVRHIHSVLKSMAKKHLFEGYESFIEGHELIEAIKSEADYESMISEMMDAASNVLGEKKKSFIGSIANFLGMWKGDDLGYARIMSRQRIRERDHIIVQYNCLDPSLISKAIIHGSHSTILMSGTLSPMEMYRDLLGMGGERTALRSYPSPFPRRNRKNIIVRGITTRYTERTQENYAKIAKTVSLCVNSIKGNAAVFFPSYEIRDCIHGLAAQDISKHIMLEDRRMSKEERDRIKEEMKEHAARGAVLFAVMGGSFSEGIDLPGELLNGVVIVGLPLKKPDLSSKALIDYYDKRFRKGMAYGYMYPAMIQVIQSAGRCIRSESDRGVIVFADERFMWHNYRCMFPPSWEFAITTRPEIEIRKFFGCPE